MVDAPVYATCTLSRQDWTSTLVCIAGAAPYRLTRAHSACTCSRVQDFDWSVQPGIKGTCTDSWQDSRVYGTVLEMATSSKLVMFVCLLKKGYGSSCCCICIMFSGGSRILKRGFQIGWYEW